MAEAPGRIAGLVAKALGLPRDNLLRFEIGAASVSRIEAGASTR